MSNKQIFYGLISLVLFTIVSIVGFFVSFIQEIQHIEIGDKLKDFSFTSIIPIIVLFVLLRLFVVDALLKHFSVPVWFFKDAKCFEVNVRKIIKKTSFCNKIELFLEKTPETIEYFKQQELPFYKRFASEDLRFFEVSRKVFLINFFNKYQNEQNVYVYFNSKEPNKCFISLKPVKVTSYISYSNKDIEKFELI